MRWFGMNRGAGGVEPEYANHKVKDYQPLIGWLIPCFLIQELHSCVIFVGSPHAAPG